MLARTPEPQLQLWALVALQTEYKLTGIMTKIVIDLTISWLLSAGSGSIINYMDFPQTVNLQYRIVISVLYSQDKEKN